MVVASSVNAYRSNQVTTISRGQLLVLAYDGILRFLTEGRAAMLERRYEAQNANLQKAQDLIVELMCALNPEAFPELAGNLERLYQYMYQRLVMANVQDDVAMLDDVGNLVSELRESWAEAERQMRTMEG